MSKQKSEGRRQKTGGRRGLLQRPGTNGPPRNHVASAFRRKNTATEAASRLQHGGEHGSERLQKILSAAGVASRRLSEELILQGRVSVNGETVRELGTRADPAADEIKVDGRRIKTAQPKRYVLLNKPRGYITSRSDPQGRPTVMDLLKGVKE